MRRRGFRSRGRASGGGGGRLLERIRDRKILALRDLRPLDRPAGLPDGVELGAAATEGRDVVLLVSRQSGEELVGWAQIGARLLAERDRAPGEVVVAAPLFGERTRRTAEWLAAVSGLPWRLLSIPSLAEKPEELLSQDLVTGGGQGWNPLASGVLERVVRVLDGAAALTASGAVRPAAVGAVLYMRGIRILTAEPESDGVAIRFLEPERRLMHVNEANFPRWAPELHEQIVQLAQDPRLLSADDAIREGAIEQSAARFSARITARWLVWRGDGAEPLDWCGIDASGRAVLGVVRRELSLAHVPALLGGLAVLDVERAIWAPGAAAGRPKLCVTAESVDGTARGVIEDLGIDFAFADEELAESVPALELGRDREREHRDRDRDRDRDGGRDRDRNRDRDRGRDRERDAARELQARDGQRDAQRDGQRDVQRDTERDAERDAPHDAAQDAPRDAQRADGQPERERTGRRRSRRRRRGRGDDAQRQQDGRPRSEFGEPMEAREDGDREDGVELAEPGDDTELAENGFEAAEPDFDAVAERTLDEEDDADDLQAMPAGPQARGRDTRRDDESDADDREDDDEADEGVRADAPERGNGEDAAGEPAEAEVAADAEEGEETTDEPPVVPARRRRQRAAIAVRNDVDSMLAALVLARERRNVPFFWVCAQHELMDFFRGKATDLDDNTDLVLVGFTAQPLPREIIGCAELYRGRLEWFDYHEWPVEDVELLGQAIGQDSIQFSQGTSGALAQVMEIAERRSRFTDKLVDLAGRRLSETDMERWGYRLMGMLRRACQKTGDYRNEIQPVLAGKPTDLPELEGVFAEELAWLGEHKPRVVNFGEYQMAVLHAPEHLDAGELGRRLRQMTGSRLSFASREGDDMVQLGYNEERRHINVMALMDHLDARMPWLHSRPGGDRVGRLEIEDLPHHPERLEEVIGEIVRSKSILYG